MRPVLAAAVLVLGFSGCPSDPCPEGGRGTLTVELSGVPEGVTPDVALHGPAGHREVVATTTLSDFDSGEYALMLGNVAAPGGRVRLAYAPVADPETVCVLDGQTATVRITYAPIPTSGRLWSGNTNGSARGGSELFSLGRDALGATGTVTVHSPTVSITRASGLAFDEDGNLWVADGSRVLMFRAGDVSGASAPAAISLTGATFSGTGARGLAFDANGSLWVSLENAKRIVRINGSEISESGEPGASIAISTTGSAGPTGLAFAPDGALWVAVGDSVIRYSANQLGAAGATSPSATIIAGGGTYNDASGLAFDAAGNLWVAYAASGKVARFSAAEVAGSGGTITPAVVLSATVSGHGMAFDEEGGLWVAITQGQIGRYAPSQLAASGSAAPEIVLTGAQINGAVWPAIYPPPAWSPLYPEL